MVQRTVRMLAALMLSMIVVASVAWDENSL